ncbi:MAG: hypothetical protein AAF708_00740 [Deinococcota bacterium]
MLRRITSRLLLLLLLVLAACGQPSAPPESEIAAEEDLVFEIDDNGITVLQEGINRSNKQTTVLPSRDYNVYVIPGNNATNAFYSVKVNNVGSEEVSLWTAQFSPRLEPFYNLVGDVGGVYFGSPIPPGGSAFIPVNVQCHRPNPTYTGLERYSTDLFVSASTATGSSSALAKIFLFCHFQ